MAMTRSRPPASPRVRPWKWRLLLALLLFSGFLEARAQSGVAKEYQVKALFLYNFSQFVQWPENSFPDAQSPLVIGVLGDNPFGGYLDQIVRGERVGNRALVVQRYRRVEDIRNCHVLFISASEAYRLDQILDRLRGRSILTVGDANGFLLHGGMIRFVTERNKIGMRIGLENARAENLVISSKLLKPAEIVPPGSD